MRTVTRGFVTLVFVLMLALIFAMVFSKKRQTKVEAHAQIGNKIQAKRPEHSLNDVRNVQQKTALT